MKALEFQTNVTPEHTLEVPREIAGQIQQGQPVRVILLLPDDGEEQQWARLTIEQFFKGYAESDVIYDPLPGG